MKILIHLNSLLKVLTNACYQEKDSKSIKILLSDIWIRAIIGVQEYFLIEECGSATLFISPLLISPINIVDKSVYSFSIGK